MDDDKVAFTPIEGIDDTAGLMAWALGIAAEQVRQGIWNTEVDTSDPNTIADALEALAWQADAQMGSLAGEGTEA